MPDTPVTAQSVSVYNATPTVKVDSQSNPTVDAQLLAMEMRESEGGLTAMELRFSNFGSFSSGKAGYVFEDDKVLKLGANIEVSAGDQSSPTAIFSGKISALEGRYSSEHPPELVVLAEDALQAARMKRRSKVYDNTTLDALVSAVATACGLTPKTDGLSDNIGTQVQWNESDLAFLRRILARYDADLQVVGQELHAARRSQVQRNQIDLSLDGKLRQARVLADLAQQVTKIEVSGWDFSQGQAASATRSGNTPGPGSGRAGSDLLHDTFAERAEQLAHISVRNHAEAQSVADAEFQQRARRFVTLHATTEGNAALHVGTHVNVAGLGPRFSNVYYVVAATHRFDQDHGYLTDFTAECAFLGGGA
ncbi:MAG TPA: contractile injection system protein, VgrG/Pvc8 family [Terriglobales bacterium]|nr:contractile injection system protein, VgrG/Pvc8 family [Terriglobales bacterium]